MLILSFNLEAYTIFSIFTVLFIYIRFKIHYIHFTPVDQLPGIVISFVMSKLAVSLSTFL